MAGALTISTLNDSSGVLATQNGMSGICKSWVNFNGETSPPTIRGSFNVGSITKNGTGDYTVNFATAMPDANYSISTNRAAQNLTDLNRFLFVAADNPGNAAPYVLAGSLRLKSGYDAQITDCPYGFVAIFR